MIPESKTEVVIAAAKRFPSICFLHELGRFMEEFLFWLLHLLLLPLYFVLLDERHGGD